MTEVVPEAAGESIEKCRRRKLVFGGWCLVGGLKSISFIHGGKLPTWVVMYKEVTKNTGRYSLDVYFFSVQSALTLNGFRF